MSGTSRKVKNPLLSAAGMGSPFEHYPENALLVPVTPATPAVLRDDVELDNFIGQNSSQSQNVALSQTTDTTIEETLKNLPPNVSPKPEEPKEVASQPVKQGYFTSILSSLPNLSLSGTKPDSSLSQTSQGFETASAKQDTNLYALPQNHHVSSFDAPSVLALDSHDLRGGNPLGPSEINPVLATPAAPPQQTLPPSAPVSTGAPVSYRLGNQRRLKYAPPPDLTSSSSRQYTNPAVPPFLSPQNVSTPSSILNPNASIIQQQAPNCNPPASQTSVNSPTEQAVTSEQVSRSASLHGSFRSSPTSVGAFSNTDAPLTRSQASYSASSFVPGAQERTISSSRPIPLRTIDPATPQNTPANGASTSFNFFTNAPDFSVQSSLTSNTEEGKQEPAFKNVDSVSPQEAFKEEFLSPDVNSTFRPISAAKVTEKLQHLLAEREEDSSSEISADLSREVTDITTRIGSELKTPELQSAAQPVNQSSEPSSQTNASRESANVAPLSKSDSLSEVPLEPVSSNVTSSTVNNQGLDSEKNVTNVENYSTPIQAVKPESNPFRQYYQTQASHATPVVSSSIEKVTPVPVASVLEPPAGETKITDSQTFKFFEPIDAKPTHPQFGHQYTDAKSYQPPSGNLTSNVHQNPPYPTFNQPLNNSSLPNPQPYWSTNPPSQVHHGEAVHNVQSQVPQFYNPTQLMGQSYKPQFVQTPIERPLISPVNFPNWASTSQESQNTGISSNFIYSPSPVSMVTAPPEPTGSATLSPVQLSVNPLSGHSSPDTVPLSFQNLATGIPERRMQYRPIYHHWFYRKEVESKTLWIPFSMHDSLKLEEVFNSNDITPETVVATDGGRFDVNILKRQKSPVYWSGSSTEVRRCSWWYYKGSSESRYFPYEENVALKLEEEYKNACHTNTWNRRVDLSNGEYIVMHSSTSMIHYLPATSPDLGASWSSSSGSEESTYLQGTVSKSRVVKRGVDEFTIEEGEPEKVDHLLFLVHGIGSVCDLKFRTVEEVVDEFRNISLQLISSHYRTASEQGVLNRIEVLPISWHTTLHSDDTGIDKKLQSITLESIPKLRHLTNDTLLDILFYTSPVYCQTIMQTVGSELNRLYALFKERNPYFNGGVYLGGHSLGSLILFDLLCHQKVPVKETQNGVDEKEKKESDNDNLDPTDSTTKAMLQRRLSRKISYVIGAAGTGQPFIHYPQLHFHPRAFFALGSPIGMFVTVRGIDTLGEDFVLPTCPAFFNIFHPFDPVAYRIEALINPEASKYRPMLIPHHKGRKRMHLELKETMARVGADLKQKFIDSLKNTWNSVYQLALFHKPDNQALEREIDKVVEEQLQQTPDAQQSQQQQIDDTGGDLRVGKLNNGRRIDYVLQEAPFEYINEYIFVLTSHVCYWKSEDTMLLILKEIYGSMGIQTDAQFPQQTLPVEPLSSPLTSAGSALPKSTSISSVLSTGVDPTAPISNKPVGPPPKTGFVRKT